MCAKSHWVFVHKNNSLRAHVSKNRRVKSLVCEPHSTYMYVYMFLCCYLPSNRFLTSTADPFSHGLNAKFVEVRLQASQHVVQLVGWFGGRRGRSHSRWMDLTEMEKQSVLLHHSDASINNLSIISVSVSESHHCYILCFHFSCTLTWLHVAVFVTGI